MPTSNIDTTFLDKAPPTSPQKKSVLSTRKRDTKNRPAGERGRWIMQPENSETTGRGTNKQGRVFTLKWYSVHRGQDRVPNSPPSLFLRSRIIPLRGLDRSQCSNSLLKTPLSISPLSLSLTSLFVLLSEGFQLPKNVRTQRCTAVVYSALQHPSLSLSYTSIQT